MSRRPLGFLVDELVRRGRSPTADELAEITAAALRQAPMEDLVREIAPRCRSMAKVAYEGGEAEDARDLWRGQEALSRVFLGPPPSLLDDIEGCARTRS